eukprot:g15617.t1
MSYIHVLHTGVSPGSYTSATGAGGDVEFCGKHVLGNTRQHVRRTQRYRTLRKMVEPGCSLQASPKLFTE